MTSLAFRVISGAIAASVLLVLPATATASSLLTSASADAGRGSEGTRTVTGPQTENASAKSRPRTGGAAAEAGLRSEGAGVWAAPSAEAALKVKGAAAGAETGGVAAGGGSAGDVAVGARLPFRLVVPGAMAQGAYELAGDRTSGGTADSARPGTGDDRKPRVSKPDGRISITLKVTRGTRCGVLQTTTNGPADGIEWYTFGVLCKPGTATFRTEANRLPWSAGTLPSVRLCNGLSPALAEGDDCDGYEPPRSA